MIAAFVESHPSQSARRMGHPAARLMYGLAAHVRSCHFEPGVGGGLRVEQKSC